MIDLDDDYIRRVLCEINEPSPPPSTTTTYDFPDDWTDGGTSGSTVEEAPPEKAPPPEDSLVSDDLPPTSTSTDPGEVSEEPVPDEAPPDLCPSEDPAAPCSHDLLEDIPSPPHERFSTYAPLFKNRHLAAEYLHPWHGRVLLLGYGSVSGRHHNCRLGDEAFFSLDPLGKVERSDARGRMVVMILPWTPGSVVRRWVSVRAADGSRRDDPAGAARLEVRESGLVHVGSGQVLPMFAPDRERS